MAVDLTDAGVAQSVEQLICNQQVGGSSPSTSSNNMGEFPSGQRGQTVNLLATPSVVRIHLPPPSTAERQCFFRMMDSFGIISHKSCNACVNPILRRAIQRHAPAMCLQFLHLIGDEESDHTGRIS